MSGGNGADCGIGSAQRLLGISLGVHATHRFGWPAIFPNSPRKIVEVVKVWIERKRSRDLLASLDERQLKDFGATRIDVIRETRKPFWRA